MPSQIETLKAALAQAETDAATLATLNTENGQLRGKVDTLTQQVKTLTDENTRLKGQAGSGTVDPVDPIAGYSKVAKENETWDTQGKTYDVAYGTNGKFVFKTGMTGKIAFNNSTFYPDPVVNQPKFGYAKLSANQPVPQQPSQPSQPTTPTTARLNGAISDAGSPEGHAPFFKELGFDSIRVWAGLWDNGDVGDEVLTRVNKYLSLGITPRIVLTPPYQGTKVVPYPAGAIAKIKAKLDKRVQINLINEPNHGGYWPNSDWMGAFQWADPVAAELRAAGFKVGSPSFTGWEDSWEGWWDQIIAKGWHKNYDVLVFHNYPNVNPDQSPDGFVARFDKTNQNAKRIATKLSGLLGRPIGVDCDEWGLGKYITDDTFAKILPALQTSLNTNTTNSAYFIISRSGTAAAPKDPHDFFNWAIDFKTGEKRQKVIDAFKAVKK